MTDFPTHTHTSDGCVMLSVSTPPIMHPDTKEVGGLRVWGWEWDFESVRPSV